MGAKAANAPSRSLWRVTNDPSAWVTRNGSVVASARNYGTGERKPRWALIWVKTARCSDRTGQRKSSSLDRVIEG